MNRKERRAAAKDGELDTTTFLNVSNKFIDLANRENRAIKATDVHMAFLYAAARYNAYVANAILQVEDHEAYVEGMTKQYQEMLRLHLADDKLAGSA